MGGPDIPVSNASITHVTVFNVTVGAKTNIFVFDDSPPNQYPGNPSALQQPLTTPGSWFAAKYDLFNGLHSFNPTASDSGFLEFGASKFAVTYNVFKNFESSSQTTLYGLCDGDQIYNLMTTSQDRPQNAGPHLFAYNFLSSSSGCNWLLQDQGQNTHHPFVVEYNVMENLSYATGIGVSVANYGPNASFVLNNSVYGAYNGSTGIGSTQGGAQSTYYAGNQVFDYDTSSTQFTTQMSNETWANQTGSWVLVNNNGTNAPALANFWYVAHTAKVLFDSDVITNIFLYGIPANIERISRPVLPNDFNITSDDSYIPSSLTTQAFNYAANYPGPIWSVSPIANPSFLNLSGYLGGFTDQVYHLEKSWLRGETTLPIVFGMLAPGDSYTLIFTNALTGEQMSQTGVDSNAAGFVNASYNSNTMPSSITVELVTNDAGGGGAYLVSSLTWLGLGLIGVGAVIFVVMVMRSRQGVYRR